MSYRIVLLPLQKMTESSMRQPRLEKALSCKPGEGFDELAGYLAFSANHEENRRPQMILDHILDRIEALLGTWTRARHIRATQSLQN